MAWLTGCNESRASDAAIDAASADDTAAPPASVDGAQVSSTVGRPAVSVPVLSNTTAVTSPAFSNATPSRIRIPRFAAALEPAMIAAGVARPMAQGQATINTAAAVMNDTA